MNITLKIAALILITGGFLLTYKPDLISPFPIQLTGYEMIEKRVKWGSLIGLGIFLIYHQQWANWGLTICALLSGLAFGFILARLLGFILDGLFAKQMLWLLIELIVFGVFAFLYWRQKMVV